MSGKNWVVSDGLTYHLDGHTIDRIEFTIDPVVDENKLNEATDMIEARVLAGEDEIAAKKW